MGNAALDRGDQATAQGYFDEAVLMARTATKAAEAAHGLIQMSCWNQVNKNLIRAYELAEQAVSVVRERGRPHELPWPLCHQAELLCILSRHGEAEPIFSEAIALARQT